MVLRPPSATNRLATASFNWYTTPTGGTPVFTGATFNTPNLTAKSRYYVEASTPDGKKSFTRTLATVNLGGGAGPLWSYGFEEESPKLGGVCLLCSVSDPANAVDGNPTTFSTLSSPVGVASTVGQLIKFPGYISLATALFSIWSFPEYCIRNHCSPISACNLTSVRPLQAPP